MKSKLKLLAITATITILQAFGADIKPDGSANFYEAAYNLYLNKNIEVNIAYVYPKINIDKSLNRGFRYFIARTVSKAEKDRYAGEIGLIVPTNGVRKLLETYGMREERSEGSFSNTTKGLSKGTQKSGGSEIKQIKTQPFLCNLRYDDSIGLFVFPESAKGNPVPNSTDRALNNELLSVFSSLSTKQKNDAIKTVKKFLKSSDEKEPAVVEEEE